MTTQNALSPPMLTASGALPALRDGPDGPALDATSFITALGLKAMRGASRTAPIAASAARMLDFIESCVAANPPGAFAFWPGAARPIWAKRVPPDADDTALCLSVLLESGRLTRAEAVRRAARAILPWRVRRVDPLGPDWIAQGAFLTWLAADGARPNVVDCAVNANVLALVSELGMQEAPGAEAASRTIRDGLSWAGGDRRRLRALTPFYPEPGEFALALERAVAAGRDELRDPARALRRLAPDPPGPDAVICSGAYLEDGWRSPALHALRTAAVPFPNRQLQEATAP